MFSEINESVWLSLESSLLPSQVNLGASPAKSTRQWLALKISYLTSAVYHSAKATLLTPVALTTSCAACIEKTYVVAKDFFKKAPESINFSDILDDSRQWNQLGNLKASLEELPPGSKDPGFLWGTASCTYQDSGYTNCPDSQWHQWEKKILTEDNQSKSSLNLFQIYKENPQLIVEKLQHLGVNTYRTSIEWSQIEKQPGVYDSGALDVYVNFFKLLQDANIEPMVTLHHFSEPKWFHDKGSFEDPKNIEDFVNFSAFIYERLSADYKQGPLVKWICTINEPAIEGFSRYVRGAYSPGVTMDFTRAGKFLSGAMKAHFAVYKRLKEINSNPDIRVGFTHQYLKFQAGNPLVIPATRYLTALINDTVLNLFKTSTFSLKVPVVCNLYEKFNKEDIKTDFVGVQYYTRPIIALTGSITQHRDEAMTAMPFREDPAGLYEAIVDTYNATNAPIIVTENGISTHSDEQRERYMERALYALKQAEIDLPQGALKGYYQWSLVDNLEWDMGMEPQAFGAYSAIKTQDGYQMSENPKPGIGVYQKVIQAWNRIIYRERVAA